MNSQKIREKVPDKYDINDITVKGYDLVQGKLYITGVEREVPVYIRADFQPENNRLNWIKEKIGFTTRQTVELEGAEKLGLRLNMQDESMRQDEKELAVVSLLVESTYGENSAFNKAVNNLLHQKSQKRREQKRK